MTFLNYASIRSFTNSRSQHIYGGWIKYHKDHISMNIFL